MFTWVMGFPVPLCTGIALTSILDVEIPGNSCPEPDALGSSFTGAAFTVASFAVERCGMLRISEYLDCLKDIISMKQHKQYRC